MPPAEPVAGDSYPVQFFVDYPDRPLNRLTTLLRVFTVIPIVILAGTIDGATYEVGARYTIVAAGGLLFAGPLLMILFREKYPLWWFEWNRELLRFHNRIAVYATLMEDRYPSTEETQAVHLELPRPYAESELNRWLPLVKWLLAIPHYVVLWLLSIGALIAVILAWFAILITGHFPRSLFDYLVGVGRWYNRVFAYAAILVTDRYPPFRLSP